MINVRHWSPRCHQELPSHTLALLYIFYFISDHTVGPYSRHRTVDIEHELNMN